jgi:hypothetical protein
MSDLTLTLWWASLAIGLVVVIVAAILLTLILRTAQQIDVVAKDVWRTGKLVARNTVHVADLVRTNQVAADILETAHGILMAAQRIHVHAQDCPGCPACLLGAGPVGRS